MSYNRDNYLRVRREYEGKNLRAKEAARRRADELHEKLPDLAAIDRSLSDVAFRVMEATMNTPAGEQREKRLEAIRSEMKQLQADRRRLLEAAGYPADYTDVRYECPLCSDVGCTTDGKMCACMKKKLILAGMESSGAAELMKTQSFGTFDLSYCAVDENTLQRMTHVLNVCREYAAGFTPDSPSLLFIGATGLGKTHLSTSIAAEVIRAGYDVVYEPAQDLFLEFERQHFGKNGSADSGEDPTARYFDCDLLIIDDLGTEMTTQFTISVFYNLLNTRIIHRRPMIVNTNLTQEDLRRRYADRITSRLFGEFTPLLFVGRDVRAARLMRQ